MPGYCTKKPPFEIQPLDTFIDQLEGSGMPQRSASFEIIWIQQALGTCTIDLEKYPLDANTVFCIDAGQMHLMQTSGPVKGYYISFSSQFLYLAGDNTWPLFENKGYSQYGMARIITLSKELQIEMELIMDKLIKEFTHDSSHQSEILRGLLKILMIYLTRGSELKKPEITRDRHNDLVRRFMILLEKNFTTKKMVCEYAGELALSPNYLNEVVKKTTGYPANHHIRQRIILEAKRQAIYYGLNMKEIVNYLGFDNSSHFSRFFKTQTGYNFKSFRKEIQTDPRLL